MTISYFNVQNNNELIKCKSNVYVSVHFGDNNK